MVLPEPFFLQCQLNRSIVLGFAKFYASSAGAGSSGWSRIGEIANAEGASMNKMVGLGGGIDPKMPRGPFVYYVLQFSRLATIQESGN